MHKHLNCDKFYIVGSLKKEEIILKYNFLKLLLPCVMIATLLTGCGGTQDLSKFKKNMDDMCAKISEIDVAINNIDPNKTTAPDELLSYLADLEVVFTSFGEMDFPSQFDYLEEMADEASTYMAEAVKSYKDAYSNGSYNEYIAEYAGKNYERAYKRLQIVLAFMHGEEPDANLSIEYDN